MLFFPDVVANDAVEIAADKVAHDDAQVKDENLGPEDSVKVKRHAQIIECVGHTVGEAAHDEERHAEEQGEILPLSGKGDGGGHDHAASDSQYAASDGTDGQTAFENLLCRFLKGHRTHAGDDGDDETTHDVAQENKEQLSHFTFLNKACSSGVEFQPVMHHREQTESKKNGADNAFLRQIAEAGDADGHSGVNGRFNDFSHGLLCVERRVCFVFLPQI